MYRAFAADGGGFAGDLEGGRCVCAVGSCLSDGASGVHARRFECKGGADRRETVGIVGWG